jgi:hypothetical protein
VTGKPGGNQPQFCGDGEAIKKIHPEITGRYPYIPWKECAGMRDTLVHEVFPYQSEDYGGNDPA